MNKPHPVNQERPFLWEEIFFSITDKTGVILFGNDTFVKISGYSRQELIGAPHNIIRHPDMPKAVFKLLWDTIKQNNPIAAFVKNMAIDGSFYWVFAFVFPLKEGYLSIRIKPKSALFKAAQDIYQSVLPVEKKDTQEAFQLLVNTVLGAGFSNYNDFMIQAAMEEFRLRDQTQHHSVPLNTKIHHDDQIVMLTKKTAQELKHQFDQIPVFQNILQSFMKTEESLNEEFKKLSYVSINMNILAEKYGKAAESLCVVAIQFSKLSTEITDSLKLINDFMKAFQDSIQKLSISLISLKVQMMMVEYFVNESLEKMNSHHDSFNDMVANQKYFSELFTQSCHNLISNLNHLKLEGVKIDRLLAEVQKSALGLEIIKFSGKMESSRDDEIHKSFSVYIKEMDNFLKSVKLAMSIFNQNKDEMNKSILATYNSNQKIKGNIDHIFEEAIALHGRLTKAS